MLTGRLSRNVDNQIPMYALSRHREAEVSFIRRRNPEITQEERILRHTLRMCLLAVWKLFHFSVSFWCALALPTSECDVMSSCELVPALRTVVLVLPSTIKQSRKNIDYFCP